MKKEAQKTVDEVRKNRKFFEKSKAITKPATPEEEILKIITRELYDFLPDHDRRTLRVAFQMLMTEPQFEDYSPAAMAVSRVYEGFLSKLLVRLGIVTQTRVSEPDFSFNAVFDSADAKAFRAKVATHGGELDAVKQRLKEFRHTNMHSNSSQFVEYTNVKDAHRFATRVLTDMQGYFQYFGKYMPK